MTLNIWSGDALSPKYEIGPVNQNQIKKYSGYFHLYDTSNANSN